VEGTGGKNLILNPEPTRKRKRGNKVHGTRYKERGRKEKGSRQQATGNKQQLGIND
jgi:hypothetical protein